MIFTIGHSTRPLDEFIALLHAHAVTKLADVRTVPKSRRYPHFAGDALAQALAEAGIAYRHFPGLGGLRKPRKDSPNSAWRHEGFRGYADYMQTEAFEAALVELIAWAGETRATTGEKPATIEDTEDTEEGTDSDKDLRKDRGASGEDNSAIMCAEAVWWRCHRQLIADALVARGIEVRHITSAAPAARHALTDFARTGEGRRVSYPGLV